MPDDPRPDTNETQDFDVPDQQALFDAFIAGLSKESYFDFTACHNCFPLYLVRVSVTIRLRHDRFQLQGSKVLYQQLWRTHQQHSVTLNETVQACHDT